MATATDHTPQAANGDAAPPAADPNADGSGAGGQSGLNAPGDVWGPPTGPVWHGGTWLSPDSSHSEDSLPEPGWYRSPDGTGLLRWWDGNRWTDDLKYLAGLGGPEDPDKAPTSLGVKPPKLVDPALQAQRTPQSARANGLVRESLVYGYLAILADLLLVGAPMGLVLGIMAVVSGVRARRQMTTSLERPAWLWDRAARGVTLGIVAIFLAVVIVAAAMGSNLTFTDSP